LKITKKETYGIIGEDEEYREILYCPYCERFGQRVILQFRNNYEEHDKELWRECTNCKRILPATSGKKTGVLKGAVEPVDNRFDVINVTGIENKRPKNYIQKYKEQLLKKANKEKDSEIRREILKGMEIDEGFKNDEQE
jgi:hypothetical protein